MNLDDMPEIMAVKDLALYLNMDRVLVSALMKTKGFPSFRVGDRYYVYREALRNWLMRTKSA